MNSTEIPTPVVLLTKQAVNCGDHGQDIVTAVEVKPGETVADLAARTLRSVPWAFAGEDRQPKVEADWYLIIRLPEPAEVTR